MHDLLCNDCEWCHGFCYYHENGKLPTKRERALFICGFRAYKGYDPVRRWYTDHDKEMKDSIAIIGYSKPGYEIDNVQPDINSVPAWCPRKRIECNR